MHFLDLKAELDNEQRHNFYIFAGAEKEVMRKYIKRIDPNAREAESFKDLIVRFQNVGLFKNGEHGTFYIYNDKSVQDLDLLHIIKLIGPDTVILIYDTIDGRSKFFKSAQNFIFEFPKFEADELAKYIVKICPKIRGGELVLSRLCNNDLARVELECDKLNRLDEPITLNLLYELVSKEAEDVIFDMIKAVAKRQIRSVFDLYEELKERKESPVKILSLLYTSFRNVIIVQSYRNLTNQQISEKTTLSSGQVYYIRELVDHFSLDRLKDHLLSTQQAEINIKTGKVDQNVALDSLLLSILR